MMRSVSVYTRAPLDGGGWENSFVSATSNAASGRSSETRCADPHLVDRGEAPCARRCDHRGPPPGLSGAAVQQLAPRR
jgi:hypothetical protein